LPFNPHLHAEAFMCAKPHVLFEGGVFRMWYTSRGYGEGSRPGDYRICYAESDDGIYWRRHPSNPIMQPSVDTSVRFGVTDAVVARPRALAVSARCVPHPEDAAFKEDVRLGAHKRLSVQMRIEGQDGIALVLGECHAICRDGEADPGEIGDLRNAAVPQPPFAADAKDAGRASGERIVAT